MDITSPEFYTIAFVVAMGLVALLMGRTEKKPPSTYIVQLLTTPDQDESEDAVRVEVLKDGKVRIDRTGFTLGDDETVNLVITIRDGECSIVEKKGKKRRGTIGESMRGEVTVKCFRPIKYHIRYESQLTSTWASFTLDASSPVVKRVTLSY
jgi:hypothetical protein